MIGNVADSNPLSGYDYNGGSDLHYLKGNIAVR